MNGIQQGDPFSPYLFTIVMEGFSYMLEEAISNGNIKVPLVGSIHISYVTFAIDLLIFLQNDSTLLRNVSTILKEFDIVSSLQSNHAKSKVYMGPYITNKDFIIDTLGVSEGSLLIPYLGLPLIFTSIRKTHYQFILQKIKTRIFFWKNMLLLIVG